jgi:hypothetical protein
VEETGKWILIYGGSSATGALAIQFAGYKVVTTCSPNDFEPVRALGAGVVLDYVRYLPSPCWLRFTYYNQVIKFSLARSRLLEQDPRCNFQLPLSYLRPDRHSGHSGNLRQRGCYRGQCTITRIWHPRNLNHSTLHMYTRPCASTPCIRITRSDHQEAFSSVYGVW